MHSPKHRGIKLNTPYPEDQYAVLEIWNEYNILEDIKRGPYSKKSPIRRIQSLDTPKDEQNMTMEEYIKLEEEKGRRRSQVFNWQTTTYGKIRVDDNLYNLRSVEVEFPAIVIDDAFTPQDALPCKSQVSTPCDSLRRRLKAQVTASGSLAMASE
ncbi:hypothetical protein Tco_0150091 [Tanacetum coccineum]